MRISLGNDHAGYPLKDNVLTILNDAGHTVHYHGSDSPEPVDFPDIAALVCASVLKGEADRGIMVCGTGVGAAIAANKIAGIRAALAHDTHCAHQCVEHDDVNVLCIGAKIIGPWLAEDILHAFLAARFKDTPELRRRVQKLSTLDARMRDSMGGTA